MLLWNRAIVSQIGHSTTQSGSDITQSRQSMLLIIKRLCSKWLWCRLRVNGWGQYSAVSHIPVLYCSMKASARRGLWRAGAKFTLATQTLAICMTTFCGRGLECALWGDLHANECVWVLECSTNWIARLVFLRAPRRRDGVRGFSRCQRERPVVDSGSGRDAPPDDAVARQRRRYGGHCSRTMRLPEQPGAL